MTGRFLILKKYISLSLIFFSSILFISVAYSYIVSAANPGYFTGSTSSGSGDYVMKRIYKYSSGVYMAVPESVDTKSEFVQFLQDKNLISGQDRTGSAYTVCTMLNLSFAECKAAGYVSDGRVVQLDGWAQLKIRLEPVTMVNKLKATYKNYTNTLYGTGSGDIHTYHEASKSRTAIDFELDGVVKYRFMRECANPVGGFPGLPPAPKNWSLTPYTSLNPTNYVEAGSSFNITSYINNTGEVTSSDVFYNLEKKVGAGAYATYSPHSGTRTFPLGDTYVTNNLSFSDTDYDAGTQICFRLSVTPRSNTKDETLTSPEDCIIIGKKPKVQVWGGDLLTRGNMQTSASVKSGKIYGSWSEYGLFAGGTITGIASGSAFSGGLTSTLSNTCSYSPLTFSNTVVSSATTCNNGDARGKYDTASKLIPDVSASFPTSSAIGAVDGTITLGGLDSGVYKAGSGDIIINGSVVPSNKWLVLNVPDKNVTISGNISYTPNTLHKLEDIPQLVIIAKTITINSNVTNVDAWLIAHNKTTKDGSIKTCDIIGDTTNKCNQRLTINGPVMTDKLYLYRTAGSGTDTNSGDPAEIINLRADAYLWAYNRVSGRGKIQTVYTKELPPRF